MTAVSLTLPRCFVLLLLAWIPRPAAAAMAAGPSLGAITPVEHALPGGDLVGMSCADAITALLAEGVPASAIVIADENNVVLNPAQIALHAHNWVVKSVDGSIEAASSGAGQVTIVIGPPDAPDPHGDDPTVVGLTAGTMLGLLAGMSLIALSVLLAGAWISRSIRDARAPDAHKQSGRLQ